VLGLIKSARYDGSEYFWINDMTPRMVMHPYKSELDGKDVSGMKDPDGNPLFVRFVETVRAHKAGYVAYLWPKPGREQPQEKVSYVQGFEPWQWIIGSGLYMDDLRAALYQHLREVALWLVVALALSGMAARMVYNALALGLAKAGEVARAIAQGDVSREIVWQGGDEINDLIVEMRRMSEGLNQTMGDVAEAAGNLALASGEIASANHDLSGRTERTASNLAQASSSLGQVTASVQGNSHAAERVRDSAAMASDVALKGGQIVTQAVQTMGDISDSSRKIADIIGVIDGIAFQTNILALNAAVEAVRAGEQGRGFAVVATEVRMLAQRSASAAREIKTLIQASVDRTSDGAQMVNAAGESMQRIVATVSEVHSLIESITTASLQQGAGIGEVNQSVRDLDDMTQQNAALVEQSAAAAQSLRDQAQQLNTAVQRFKLRPRRMLVG
jgi:methyl-accepting chemotaxis protein